jgi:uncharacterized membrane protein YqaE (UPF0057 family)
MRYVIAILLPPLGMALCGKIVQAIICTLLMLTCVAWPVASIWSLLVVQNHDAELRNQQLIQELRRRT